MKTIFLSFILSLTLWVLKAEDQVIPPKDKEHVEPTQTEYNNRFASRFLAIGDLEKATIFVKKALELSPNDQNALLIMTNILIQSEKFEEAQATVKNAFPNAIMEQLFYLVDKCLAVEPASKKTRTQALAWALEAQNQSKKLDKWVGLLLAKVYFRNNEIDKSIEIAKPFIEAEPKNKELNILFGNIYTKKGEYEIAAKYLAKGMHRQPLKFMCYNHISYQLLTYDDEADNRPIIALSYAILASDGTNQRSPDIEDTLALAYFKTNDLTNAKIAQERAIKYLKDELHPEQRDRSTKLMGFKKQLLIYENALKNSAK